jgi:cytochrome bd-type quinol oxidase subunit 1
MDTGTTRPRAISVRWPFRILAGLIVLASLTVGIGFLVMARSRGASILGAKQLVPLPGVLWLMHLGWVAAVRGRAPFREWWPFASGGVVFGYFVVLLFVFYT